VSHYFIAPVKFQGLLEVDVLSTSSPLYWIKVQLNEDVADAGR
jgi:hypothetical protein